MLYDEYLLQHQIEKLNAAASLFSVVVGFTGTQEGLTLLQKRLVVLCLRMLKAPTYYAIHGDCVGGDEFFGTAAAQLDYYMFTRPGFDREGNSPKRAYSYSDKEFEPEYYLARNQKIVEASDIMLACPKGMEEEQRSGTWYTIRYARKIGKPVVILYPR